MDIPKFEFLSESPWVLVYPKPERLTFPRRQGGDVGRPGTQAA